MVNMQAVVLAAVVVMTGTGAALGAEIEEGVYVGTDENLSDLIDEHPNVLVEFYAPWCGHCKSLAPEYTKAATQLLEDKVPAVLVKIDATENEKSAEEYNIEGFPTLIFFRSGTRKAYNGGRTSTEIVQWLARKTGPAAVPVKDKSSIEKEQASNGGVLVLGFFSSADSKKYAAFTAAADASDVAYAVSTDINLATDYRAADESVLLLADHMDAPLPYNGEFEAEAITTWAKTESIPSVIEFSEANAPKIFENDVKTHLLLIFDPNAEDSTQHHDAFAATAEGFKGRVLFITLDGSQQSNLQILDFFGVSPEQMPTYRLVDVSGEITKFAPDTNDLTEAGFTAFAQQYLDGNLKPHRKTEPLPADWDQAPVKVLTGENFDEVAKDANKHVFVEFYAPWCGHCKHLAPIFDKLGEAFEGEDDVVIAKLDATANDLDSVSIESFPTLHLFPKGEDSDLKEYQGERELADMIKFINDEAGTSVAAPEQVDDEDEEEESKAVKHDEM